MEYQVMKWEEKGRSAFEESPECLVLAFVRYSAWQGRCQGHFQGDIPLVLVGLCCRGRPGLDGEVHSSSLLVCLLQAACRNPPAELS